MASPRREDHIDRDKTPNRKPLEAGFLGVLRDAHFSRSLCVFVSRPRVSFFQNNKVVPKVASRKTVQHDWQAPSSGGQLETQRRIGGEGQCLKPMSRRTPSDLMRGPIYR